MRTAAFGSLVIAVIALVVMGAAPEGQAAKAPTLAADWPAAKLQSVLLARDAWRPVPAIGDRAGWARVSPGLRARIVSRGEQALKDPIAPLPATLFLDYTRTGNRGRFESAMFGRRDRLHALVLAECVEDRGRFLDAIADTAWAVAEESSWTVPAHQGAQKAPGGLPDTAEPIVDLFSAQTAHSLAWTWYLLGDRLDTVSPLVRPRLAREIDRRVLAPYEQREDFWWMGFAPRASRPNNWNPWINSNVLAAALLVEPDPARRAALVHKTLRSLDAFLGPHPSDGGCDEGPSYWGRAGASLFEALEVLQSASAGRVNYFANPVVADIGRYISRVRIAGTWFVDVGDSGAKVGFDRGLVFRYGKAIGDPGLAALGSSGAAEETIDLEDRSIGRTLFSLFGAECAAGRARGGLAAPARCVVPERGHAVDDRAGPRGVGGGLLPGRVGLAQRPEPQSQRRRQRDRVRGRRARARGRRPSDLHGADLQQQAVRHLGHAVRLPQPADRQRPDAEGRRRVPRPDVVYRRCPIAAAALIMDISPAYPEAAGVASWSRTALLDRGRAGR